MGSRINPETVRMPGSAAWRAPRAWSGARFKSATCFLCLTAISGLSFIPRCLLGQLTRRTFFLDGFYDLSMEFMAWWPGKRRTGEEVCLLRFSAFFTSFCRESFHRQYPPFSVY